MSESPVETLEKAIVLHLFWTGALTSLWKFERCAEYNASKGDDVWLFLKIDRNTNITVPTNKGCLASRLTFRSICIVLPSLVYLPEVSVITRQEYWLRWTNPSFKWPSMPKLENVPQVPAATRANSWNFPLASRWGPTALHCMLRSSVFPLKHVRNLVSLMELKRIPKDTVTRREENWCHVRNAK